MDDDAFVNELMDLIPAGVRLARVLGLRSHEAADAAQEAVILAWRQRSQVRGPLQPWFLAIVRRRALRVRRWLTVPTQWSSAAAEWPHPDGIDDRLVAALRTLPRRQRAAVWLRYALDASTGDVASVLGISEAAAKQLLLRARSSLRTRLISEANA